MPQKVDEIARTWIEYQELSDGSKKVDEKFWAVDALQSITDNDPELLWQIILLIYGQVTSEESLGALAAGPLEDLLATHGEAFIDRIEKIAMEDQKMRRVLSGVWQNAMSDKIWARVQKASE